MARNSRRGRRHPHVCLAISGLNRKVFNEHATDLPDIDIGGTKVALLLLFGHEGTDWARSAGCVNQ